MQSPNRIVTQLPLTTLWINNVEVSALRERYLDTTEIRELLKQMPLVFIIADVGKELQWIEKDKCFAFWKEEVEIHVANDIHKIILDDFMDGYAFIASQWTSEEGLMVLLEKVH
jgi:hypothetical protein